MVEDVGHHQEGEAKDNMLRAQRRRCLQGRVDIGRAKTLRIAPHYTLG